MEPIDQGDDAVSGHARPNHLPGNQGADSVPQATEDAAARTGEGTTPLPTGIRVVHNTKGVRDYLKLAPGKTLVLYGLALCLACVWGALMPLWMATIELVFRIRCILNFVPQRQNHYCKTVEKSYGRVNAFTCPKTQRTYLTRFWLPERDGVDAGHVLANAFAKDPLCQYIFPDINLRHTLSSTWFKLQVEAPTADVFLQEWTEQEKLVGVCVVCQRKGSFLDDLVYCTRLFLFLLCYAAKDWKSAHGALRVVLALEERSAAVLERFGQNTSSTKFLGVEKGFQGTGIGSNLVDVTTRHADALGQTSYIESSNLANVPLYQRYGYVVFEEYHCTPDCPPLYLMLRKPKSRTG